ncbi:fusion of urease beta and gamma subunits [Campylobacter lari]|uniref:Urease subunit alpha n=5 Tax=Campylobacter lari TaxID=201 RepID=URE23_CAMLA|nr:MULTISPECIES: urease subunit beta [Campylobacter]Q5FB24.1 RecName: Full=Urease subunit alpha; AltName: Full=Urea amidohydrolase subunit alpha [Campylobacter lari]MCR8686118.1 urease subunit beta [Campylobacter sp. 1569]AJD00897.1 fusion of urease beta and gamma subunits [Campylobacter lari NCTC 11845]AJD02599.1 fusion of urease beta and gamma subunits [Campylobacter lari CCUG 22395]AJD04080.1 fusion of urease beta and gamma subunits [Campylobacter lari RM16701]AKJ52834.1 Urease subunit alp
MHFTQQQLQRLMLHYAGKIAKDRKEQKIKLNYNEALAYICYELMELARKNLSVSELMSIGKTLLTSEDVIDGVASMLDEIQIELPFEDGTKLVTIHEPIANDDKIKAGEIFLSSEFIVLNENKTSIEIKVSNKGDRPIQVGSHFHFFEVNRFLSFDREKAYGKRLNIASGTSVRFEPGEEKTVSLIEFGGLKKVLGFNNLCDDFINDENKTKALSKAKEKGFL